MTICIYDYADNDGRCAAHLVQKHYREKYNETIDIVGMRYHLSLREKVLDNFDLTNQTVFFVDYFHTANIDDMIELTNSCKKLIVLDHHKTSYDMMKDLYHCDNPLVRNKKVIVYSQRGNYPISGTMLTYLFLNQNMEKLNHGRFYIEDEIVMNFADIDVPPYVQLINNYDVWIHDPLVFNFLQTETKDLYPVHLNEALNVSNVDLHDENNVYEALAAEEQKECELLNQLCVYGTLIERYNSVKYANEAQLYAFEFYIVDIDGKLLRCIAMNARSDSRCLDVFNYEDYSARIVFNVKNDKVKMSFYSENKQTDCSKIANRFGGGGHRGAAGCHIHISQYNELIQKSKELEIEYDKENF
jgi:nanoRNase/pAp phosphatase (c-di-AMP/oligoRNAs hydrolase)